VSGQNPHLNDESDTVAYPRTLRPKELDLLMGVLPAESPGYREYRDLLLKMVVLGEGRRGIGNIVLGFAGDMPDTISPLSPVVAYGMVETTENVFSITVREYAGRQIDVEIVSSHGGQIPDRFEEKRRWTYSAWKPGISSPLSGEKLREVRIDDRLVLGIARNERRLLLHDSSTGMIHLIPITNFHNELMLAKNIRDPKIALNSNLFFQNLQSYSDNELRAAFVAYNNMKRRVAIAAPPPSEKKKRMSAVLRTLFRKQTP
jgi:hypothetical protein